MSQSITRRALAAGLLAFTAPAKAGAAPADPIFALIEAHRLAAEEDRRARTASHRAAFAGDPAYADLAAERRRLCKLRHSRRRELRAGTPTTAGGFQALAVYYAGIVPNPDPDNVAGRCATDYRAAADRAIDRNSNSGRTSRRPVVADEDSSRAVAEVAAVMAQRPKLVVDASTPFASMDLN